MSVFPVTTLKQAQSYLALKKWKTPSVEDESPYFTIRGEGSDAAKDAIEILADELKAFGAKSPLPSEFDAQAREIIHRNLAMLEQDVLSSADFWRYLSAVRFRDIVERRHRKTRKSKSTDGVDGNWNNYGALRSEIRESLFFRLFTGAELAYDSSNPDDPYHLTRIHDVDLWQSHIVRVFSGDNPRYARALVEWFRDRDVWYEHVRRFDVKSLFAEFNHDPKLKHLRDFVKRVRRLRSNVVHEYLTDDEIREVVSIEAIESLGNIGQWGKVKKAKKESAAEVKD